MQEKTMEIDGNVVPYNKNFAKFIEDMENAGLEVEFYQGRYFYKGPAVRCDNIQDVLSETKVKCQWDNMALGWIVYPKD